MIQWNRSQIQLLNNSKFVKLACLFGFRDWLPHTAFHPEYLHVLTILCCIVPWRYNGRQRYGKWIENFQTVPPEINWWKNTFLLLYFPKVMTSHPLTCCLKFQGRWFENAKCCALFNLFKLIYSKFVARFRVIDNLSSI